MIVLDAGALVALDRNDRQMWADIDEAARAELPVVVPAGALAQAWRDGARQARLARALDDCETAVLDELTAKAVGLLCARTRKSDVVDASVAIAGAHPEVQAVYTSDPTDIGVLLRAAGVRRPNVVRC